MSFWNSGMFSNSQLTNSSPVKHSWYSPRIGNLTGRRGISVLARDKNAEICGYVNGSPARRTFWLSASASFSDPGSDMVTVNLEGRGGDKGGGDTAKSTSVALPFPLSLRCSGSGDLSASASKT